MPADAVLTWRRSVYERGLWAVPLAADASAGTHGATAAAGRERRLEEWVGRELRALFQSDVSTVAMRCHSANVLVLPLTTRSFPPQEVSLNTVSAPLATIIWQSMGLASCAAMALRNIKMMARSQASSSFADLGPPYAGRQHRACARHGAHRIIRVQRGCQSRHSRAGAALVSHCRRQWPAQRALRPTTGRWREQPRCFQQQRGCRWRAPAPYGPGRGSAAVPDGACGALLARAQVRLYLCSKHAEVVGGFSTLGNPALAMLITPWPRLV